MADFFFFTDQDLIDDNGQFPGITTIPYSLHTVNKSPTAHPNFTLSTAAGVYAVCSGKVLVDSLGDTDSTKCTLILKPDVQPSGLPKIKYIIYSGVLRESLVFAGNYKTLVQPPFPNFGGQNAVSPYFNNLSLNVYKTTNKDSNGNVILSEFHQNSGGTDIGRPIEIIDLAKKFAAFQDAFLEHCFEQDNNDFQTFTVKGGDRLGVFFKDTTATNANVKMMILMDTPHVNLTWQHLRNIFHPPAGTISTDFEKYYPFSATTPPAIVDRMKRDLLNNFLDPAAFYGNILSTKGDNLYYRKFADSYTAVNYSLQGNIISFPETPIFTPLSGSLLSTQTGYNDLMRKFSNKNRVYIDIRDNEGYSYNFAEDMELDPSLPNKDIRVSYNGSGSQSDYADVRYESAYPCLTLEHKVGGQILVNGSSSTLYLTPAAGSQTSKLLIELRTSKSAPFTLKPAYSTSGFQISPSQVKLHNDIKNSFISESVCAVPTPSDKSTPAGLIYSNSSLLLKESSTSNFYEIKDIIDFGQTPPVYTSVKRPFQINLPLIDDGGALLPIANYIKVVYIKGTVTKPTIKASATCDAGDPFQGGTKSINDIVDYPICRAVLNFDYLDNFFMPFKMRPPIEKNTTTASGQGYHFDVTLNFPKVATNVYFDEYFCDNTSKGAANAFMAFPGIAVDKGLETNGDVTLFAFATENISKDASQTDNNFKITGAIGASSFFLEQAIASNGGASTGLIFNRKKLLATDIGMSSDAIVSYISENSSISPKSGFLSSVSLSTFPYITINKTTWKNLVAANFGTFPVGGGGTTKFIVPERTRLSLKLIKKANSPAYDMLNLTSAPENVEYEKYELYLTGEIENSTSGSSSGTITKSFATGLYTFKINNIPASPSLTSAPSLPTGIPEGNGYRIDSDSGVWRIKTTIFLVPQVGVSDSEIYYYKQFFESNIKQIWTNLTNIGPYNKGLHEDSASFPPPTTSVQISAECIDVLIGTQLNLANLGDNQLGFIVAPLANPDSRSRVDSSNRRGIMFFNKNLIPNGTNGLTRYFEPNPANTPAHEFGHCLYLNDRYTYVARYNNSTKLITPNTIDGISAYMRNDSGNTIDIDYSKLYNWLYNLYSTQAYTDKTLNQPKSDDPNVVLDDRFIDLYTDTPGNTSVIHNDFYQDSVATTGCNTYNPITSAYTTTFINPQQFNHALDNVSKHITEEEFYKLYAEFHRKYFFYMRYFMFFNKSSTVNGTFVGLKKSASFIQSKNDFGYSISPAGTADVMENRNEAAPNIDGFFSPILTYKDEEFELNNLSKNYKDYEKFKEDLMYGGLNTVKGLIDAFPKSKLKSELEKLNNNITFDSSSKIIDISGSKNIYEDIGYGNTRGIEIWNKSKSGVISKPYHTYTIKYSEFPNRVDMINTISPK